MHVPAGIEQFWVEFGSGRWQNRFSVWNADGERVWDGYGAEKAQRVELTVPPGQAGRLWRATGGSFRLDPRIPSYLSVSRLKWFNPDE